MTDTPDLRTALNRMLWRRSGKGAWCVFCMADTGNDHEPDCPTIEVHAALAQSEGEEINRLAREKLHRSGKNLVPEDTPALTCAMASLARTAAVDLASSRITYYEDDDSYVCEDCGASWEGERNDPNEHANACSVGVLLSALKDQATWFENHIIVMPGMHEHVTVLVDKEQEEKLKQAVSGRTFTEQAGD